jgi:hypothetical protein
MAMAAMTAAARQEVITWLGFQASEPTVTQSIDKETSGTTKQQAGTILIVDPMVLRLVARVTPRLRPIECGPGLAICTNPLSLVTGIHSTLNSGWRTPEELKRLQLAHIHKFGRSLNFDIIRGNRN